MRGIPQIMVVDFLAALVLLLFALVKLATFRQHASPPRIDTFGAYAVVVRWASASDDDIDTYVESPGGALVWFGSPSVDRMHLERDDVGRMGDDHVRYNGERVILRGTDEGEYVVNVHVYRKGTPTPDTVSVAFWRLRGADAMLHARRVTLRRKGEERTAFRFVVRDGKISRYDSASKSVMGRAYNTPAYDG